MPKYVKYWDQGKYQVIHEGEDYYLAKPHDVNGDRSIFAWILLKENCTDWTPPIEVGDEVQSKDTGIVYRIVAEHGEGEDRKLWGLCLYPKDTLISTHATLYPDNVEKLDGA